ncbi:MAG: glycosyltransferase family 4 protein [Fimbriimonadaceae bacterium]
MRVVLSTTVQAHTFDVARELRRRGWLAALFTGYPRSRMAAKGLGGPEVRCFPIPVLVGMLMNRLVRSQRFALRTEAWPKVLFDRWVSRRLPECDLFLATSSVGLASGRAAKAKGAFWVCDRPCSHILTQDRLLHEEYRLNGLRWPGISRTIVERELAEYREADAVLVASSFAERSFVQEHGFPRERLWKVPYGIDLSRFYPDGEPDPSRFDVLFVGQLSFQKGVPYLLEAYDRLEVPNKRLTLVGAEQPGIGRYLGPLRTRPDVRITGVLPQNRVRQEMSGAHVLVHPSVQEGLALVQAQALACGCKLICTTNTGGEDLIGGSGAGLVVPIRDVDALVAALERVAEEVRAGQLDREQIVEHARRLPSWPGYVDAVMEQLGSARGTRA